MHYFTAFYRMPVEELDAWMKTPEEERKAAEAAFQQQWDAWLAAHKDSVLKTIAMGKTKLVTDGGVEDTRNDMLLSSYVKAETLEEAANLFKDHPHLTMPGGVIEIVENREM